MGIAAPHHSLWSIYILPLVCLNACILSFFFVHFPRPCGSVTLEFSNCFLSLAFICPVHWYPFTGYISFDKVDGNVPGGDQSNYLCSVPVLTEDNQLSPCAVTNTRSGFSSKTIFYSFQQSNGVDGSRDYCSLFAVPGKIDLRECDWRTIQVGNVQQIVDGVTNITGIMLVLSNLSILW